jgi:hypothetical protein
MPHRVHLALQTLLRFRLAPRLMTGLAVLVATASAMSVTSVATEAERPFEIHVLDEQTGRGVPLVELKTVNDVLYVTDSAGRIAFAEPGLMGREVFFHIRSHGYSYPKDGFGFTGVRLVPKPGERAEVRLKRTNVAERLYRITGGDIYRDSVILGRKPPIAEPYWNAGVVGQDSAQAVVYGGKIHWFWGDSNFARYPLGLFRTSGATSELPGKGGLDPWVGVNLRYFVDDKGLSRAMCPLGGLEKNEGVVWIDGVVTVPDEQGRERMVAHYARMKSLGEMLEHGIALWSDEKQVFERATTLDLREMWRFPHGHPFRHREGEREYIYSGTSFPTIRVPATLKAVLDPTAYEQLSTAKERPSPTDVETGKPVRIHGGSVRWNAHRKKWILIAVESGGTSFLGEVWYSEADQPTGPWPRVRKIVTHDKYSFYNPVHHDFFDQADGRYILFEGTYTRSFSGNPSATPRYEYNQIMYRLDLDDPRLRGVRQ